MRYFLDTEFNDDGKLIDLISIGIVSEDGREFYYESSEFDLDSAAKSYWLSQNILVGLSVQRSSRDHIKNALVEFIGEDTRPEFWGWYCSYDWVALCQLFGPMLSIPEGWSKRCNDIKQLVDQLGNPKLSDNLKAHNALEDAKWNKEVFELMNRLDFRPELKWQSQE